MAVALENKRVTITDVAASAGVTKSTVSQVLAGKGNYSEETRARIQHAARQLNYAPDPLARRLSSGHFDSEVAIFTLILDLHVGTEKVRQIQDSLTGMGFEVPVYACGSGQLTPTGILQGLRRQRPRAIIANTANMAPDTLRELQLYQKEGGTLVCYDVPTGLDCDRVIFDREDNSYQAALHMLQLGHRKVGFCSSGNDFEHDPRFLGFCRALREYDAPLQPEWVIGTDSPNTMYEKSGAELAGKFLQLSEKPTAMCVGGDYAASCFAAKLASAGVKVPADVSIAGHDDAPIAEHGSLPLTTVTHPVNEIVNATVQLLNERLQGYTGPSREIVIGSRLIVRESSGPPPSGR